MALFKFRLSANAPAVAAEVSGATPGESVEVLRRRARHRLIGAVVLVFVAVVAFPLLFDSQPRPVAVDTPILIPDRQNTSPLAVDAPVPAAQAPAKPLLAPVSTPVATQASLDGKEEVVAVAKPSASAVQDTESKPSEKSAAASVPKASAPVVADKPAKPSDKPMAKTGDDGQKAKALLEGKAADPAGRVVIQVGAFADADKVREVRRKLEQAGLKTYTQTVEGKDGKRSTRVRLGPYESRAEADKAAARVRKLDLSAHLIAL